MGGWLEEEAVRELTAKRVVMGRAAGWRQVEGLWDILTTSVSRVGVMVMDLQSGCV